MWRAGLTVLSVSDGGGVENGSLAGIVAGRLHEPEPDSKARIPLGRSPPPTWLWEVDDAFCFDDGVNVGGDRAEFKPLPLEEAETRGEAGAFGALLTAGRGKALARVAGELPLLSETVLKVWGVFVAEGWLLSDELLGDATLEPARAGWKPD